MKKYILFLVIFILFFTNVNSQDTIIRIDTTLKVKLTFYPSIEKHNYRIIGDFDRYAFYGTLQLKVRKTNFRSTIINYNDSGWLQSEMQSIMYLVNEVRTFGRVGDTFDDYNYNYSKFYKDSLFPKTITYSYLNWANDGWFISYYSKGTVSSKGKYYKDLKDGVWKYYNEEGVLIRREKYKKGKLVKKT